MVTKMDTLTLHQENLAKLIASTLNVSIIAGLLFAPHILEGPPIVAQELIAHNAIVSPIFNGTDLEKNVVKQLSIEQRTKNYNEEIKKKYKNAVIYDVDKGVKHIKLTKYYQGKPVKINVIEINSDINPNLSLAPVLASSKMGHKNTITTIAKQNNSIVAINGTFFKPATGVPLGTLMIDKKLYTGPIYNRVAMGIFDNKFDMARIQLDASVKYWGGSLKVDNINQPRMLASYVIAYTPEWGKSAPISPKYGKQIAVQDNKIVAVSANPLEIPQNGFVIVGPSQKLDPIVKENRLTLDVKTIPQWENVKHIIGGGPYLVKDNQVYVDVSEQKLGSIGGKNPRSAIGYTADNHLIIVAVDGRENNSVGMTLTELAQYMKSIGCFNAMNLDGGGSTVLYVNGKVVNNPQVKGGIALSNAIVLNKNQS